VNGGINHFTKLDAMAGYAQFKKVPAAKAAVVISGLALLLGGLSIVLGVWADLGGLVSSVVLAAMAFKMHDFWAQADAKQNESIAFFKNISMAGAALYMFAVAADGNFGPQLVEALFYNAK
jgi:putative oxidoreductase